ncbi:hypothetical protein FA95DRAFT_72056 [Auriscalpium vulgare]|uniref:Uncharacterized protein n=1 Tax=Auriscalpium vulgare TaxID=40419 RepID=A0ACB8RQ24_9AGAM|nr:hypothetical protein FA95DRAFT_72056 [Auriscalpium vulgare]
MYKRIMTIIGQPLKPAQAHDDNSARISMQPSRNAHTARGVSRSPVRRIASLAAPGPFRMSVVADWHMHVSASAPPQYADHAAGVRRKVGASHRQVSRRSPSTSPQSHPRSQYNVSYVLHARTHAAFWHSHISASAPAQYTDHAAGVRRKGTTKSARLEQFLMRALLSY